MKIYQSEKKQLMLYIMPACGVIIMIFLTILRIITPEDWIGGGYLVSILFMILWTGISFLFTYFFDIKPRKKHKLFKKLAITNGIKTNGKIVDSSRETVRYVNGEPSSFVYYAEIELENGENITTDALLIDPEFCEKEVTVYVYEDKYYVTDFKIVESVEKIKEEHVEKTEGYMKVPLIQSVITTIFGAIFAAIMMWLLVKAADNVTRIIIIPFFISGMGVFLQGILPLIFYKNQKIVVNIGKKIYLFAFFLYWFGFLIVFDIVAIKEKNIGMFLFSLIFWIVGILTFASCVKGIMMKKQQNRLYVNKK